MAAGFNFCAFINFVRLSLYSVYFRWSICRSFCFVLFRFATDLKTVVQAMWSANCTSSCGDRYAPCNGWVSSQQSRVVTTRWKKKRGKTRGKKTRKYDWGIKEKKGFRFIITYIERVGLGGVGTQRTSNQKFRHTPCVTRRANCGGIWNGCWGGKGGGSGEEEEEGLDVHTPLPPCPYLSTHSPFSPEVCFIRNGRRWRLS